MDKFIMLIKSIDWIFAIILLIGGRYWGKRYFKISKNQDVNFLVFATVWGIAWLAIRYLTNDLHESDAANLCFTYLFTTSFYGVIGKKLFSIIENLLPWFKADEDEKKTAIIIDKKGEVTDIVTDVKPGAEIKLDKQGNVAEVTQPENKPKPQ